MTRVHARRTLSLACAVVALGLNAAARADVPPQQHGFVDSCSVSNQEDADTRCEACTGSGDALEECRERLRAEGYTLGCRAHARPEEVWCAKAGGKAARRRPWLVVFALAGVVGVALLLKRTLRSRPK